MNRPIAVSCSIEPGPRVTTGRGFDVFIRSEPPSLRPGSQLALSNSGSPNKALALEGARIPGLELQPELLQGHGPGPLTQQIL
jgi:hypothetical protein